MDFDAVNKLSIAFAIMVFCIFALTSFLVASSLFYAVYKERRLRIPSAMLVLNLCAAKLLVGGVSGFIILLADVLQLSSCESSQFSYLKSYVEAFSMSIYFQALFLIAVMRYGLALCGEKLCRVSMKQIGVFISLTWIISLVYAALVSFYEQQGRINFTAYPRGVAAAQFTFLGLMHFGAMFIYGNLVIYFHQKKDNLPPDFYSFDSSSRRIAERNIRVSIKNIQMIALLMGTLTWLTACHLPNLVVLVTAMLTGQLSHKAKVFTVALIHCGTVIHFVLYGYLNKRFKRIIRPMKHRSIDRVTNRKRRRKINEFLPPIYLSTSSGGIIFSNSRDTSELTRSKLAFLYR